MVRTSPGYLPPPQWGGAKTTLFWDRLRTLTEHISATEHDINNREKFFNLRGLPYMPPNLVNFGPETAENG